MRRLTASATGWDAGIWDFGTAANLPTLRPPLPPASPGDVTATALGLTAISISWDSVDRATSYEVYNRGALVTTIDAPATSHTATDLLPDTQYTYRVRACNVFGCSAFASASAMTMVIRISSAADLAAIRTDSTSLARDYALTGNIDLSDIANWQPIGDGTNAFTGSFDGNGYNISGVSSSGYQYAGLFGYVDDASISNVGVLVGSISSSSNSNSYSGGLVGFASSSQISNSYAVVEGDISSSSNSYSYSGGLVGRSRFSEISNSYAVVGGSISSSLGSSYSGGLVGYAYYSPISNSYALVGGSISSSFWYFSDLSSSSDSSSSNSNSYSGGLVGYASNSPISNSYVLVGGSISASSFYLSYSSDSSDSSSSSDSYSGGLVGHADNQNPISNSYAVVEGGISSSASSSSFLPNTYSGGLVGRVDGSSVTNSYYNASRKSSEGEFDNSHGTSQTVAELRALTAAATSWDAMIWDFGTAANLPILHSLPSPAVTASPGSVTATALGLTSISISWDSVVGATYYEVYNSSGLVTTIDAPATSYAATGLLPEMEYTYRVRACNLFGCSAFVSASTITRATSVSSAAELATIRTNSATLSGYYALTGNIDLSHISNWQPIGDSTNAFTGSFDGNGYNISGVSSSGYQYAGLFGYVRNANISNVGVVVGNISSSSSSSFSILGGLVGYASNSPISNSYAVVEGDISSSSSRSYSGGLVGYASNSPISNSYAVVGGDISSSSSRSYSGGLVGYASNSPISNSYAVVGGDISSSTTSSSHSGGLVGYAERSPISNSYAVVGGSISSFRSSSSYSGGLVGRAYYSPISNSYAVVEGGISSSSRFSYSGGLVGLAQGNPISNSYAVVAGSISSSSSRSNSGGLVGGADDNSPISKSYYSASRKSSEGEFSNTNGTSQTVAELRALTADATGWDAGIWDFGTDANLPKLRFLSFPIATSSLASPEDVTATALSLSSISMSWSNVVGATSYEVYNSEGLVGSTSHPATSYTATGLLPATQYTYRVRACNLFGCSDFASDVSATTDSIGTSSAPQVTLVASTIGRAVPSLKVSWDSIAGVTSYQIFDATGNNKVATVPAPSTEYVVAGLAAGTLYEYQVRGCYASGVSASPPESSEICGELSEVGSATTSIFIPSAPSGVTATVLGITSLSISWNSVEEALTYQVHNSGNLVATIEAPTTSYTARGLLPNTGYTYSVKACNDTGCSASVSASATTENGITISSAADLAAIHTNSSTLAGDYALTGNIDLSHIPNWQPIGDFTNKFTGSFDGNGYNISGVSSSGYQYAGLFGYVENADISNVGVLVGNISSSSSSDSYSGGLVGYADYSEISNSYAVVEGGISSDYNSGGLVGYAEGSQISNSYAVVEGSISSSSSSSGFSASGGLVGWTSRSPISNSYAVVAGSISSSSSSSPLSLTSSYSGGLVGLAYNGSPISNSYAVVAGSISSSSSSSSYSSSTYSYSGGLVGYADYSEISNSYAVVARSISSSSSSSSDSYSYSGGLVGFADSNGPISNSYAVVAGSISTSSSTSSSYSYSSSYSGGLVGLASYSPISNSYAVVGGSISSSSSGDSYSGGLVGRADDNSDISKSYYRAIRNSFEGEFTNTNGTSQTVAELRRLTADATGWDEVVWDFGTNNDLPTLRSSHSAGIVSPLPLLPDPDTDPAPDPDSNNGVGKETNRDTDGDGTPDHVDTDDDDDNYSDALDVDDDGDGLIEIATAEQLNQVRHNLLGGSLKTSAGDAGADTGCGGLNGITECNGYELVADISLAGYNSNNWLPIGSCPTFTEANVCTDVSVLFNAVFDGNGYTISNLTITNSIDSYTNATGLFGAISPASQLRNIHIRSANLIGGANNVGVLVGYAARASIIDSSAVGEITAYGANVGGLVGYGWNTTIISSYAAGGNIVGVSGVGGLIGSGERATISSSYAAGGDVGGVVYIGGLVGSGNSVTISLSYAAGGHVAGALGGAGGLVGSGENARVISSYAAGGNVSGFASIGGLIGSGENAMIISSYAAGGAVLTGFGVGDGLVGSEGVTATDSYWDSDTTGVEAGIYGLPQTTRELQSPTSAAGIYTNWATDECDDGGDAWDFGTASQYPVLTCTPGGADTQRQR